MFMCSINRPSQHVPVNPMMFPLCKQSKHVPPLIMINIEPDIHHDYHDTQHDIIMATLWWSREIGAAYQTSTCICILQWLISMGRRIFLPFPWNFNVMGINMHQKVEDRTMKTEWLLEKVAPFSFELLVVPHLKFWKWQSKIFSLQKLNVILVLFKTVKSIIIMAFRMFSKQAY